MKSKSIYIYTYIHHPHILTAKEYSIGLLYKERKLKTIEKLKQHKANYSTWLNQDKLNNSLFKSISLYNMTSFLSSNFECNCNKTNQYIISIDSDWSIMNMMKHSRTSYTSNGSISINTSTTSNLILRNKIIKLSNNNINLRTFALKCTFRLLLSGECYFFIFSRIKNENDFNENTLVCFISKEIESSRIFVNYAVFEQQPIDNNNNNNKLHLHIIKKQEIPNQKHYNNCIDVTDVYFNFIDNGNDNNNCIMFFPYQKSYHQNFIADFYYPQYELCNLYIAVSGDLISLKELNITSTETKISLNDIKYNYKQQQQQQLNKSVCCLCF